MQSPHVKYGSISDTVVVDEHGSTVTNSSVYFDGKPQLAKRQIVERRRTDKTDIATIKSIIIDLLNDPAKFDAAIELVKNKHGDTNGCFDLVVKYSMLIK